MAQTKQTALEVLERWRRGNKYLGDPDPGASEPESVYEDAALFLQLAREEKLDVEVLVPDEKERKELRSHVAILDEILREEHDGWPEELRD